MTNRQTVLRQALCCATAMGLLLSACGGKKDGGVGAAPEKITRGGSVTYGLEAESDGGFCLANAQLAISGITVARSIFDTLTVPNDKGEYVPYLAQAIEHNDDFTSWTITLRTGIKFHDGSPLTPQVVKNNLDAYRGADTSLSPLLLTFVLDNIKDVNVSGANDVIITTKTPWVAIPAFLYSSGRLGIMAQAQMDNPTTCSNNPIGTGPFKLAKQGDWVKAREMKLTRNPNFWQKAPDGKPYPYLDELVFKPIIEPEQRANGIETGDIDLGHFNGAPEILSMKDLANEGEINEYDSDVSAELAFMQINNSKGPLSDVRVRRAMALAIDPEEYTKSINEGQFEMANGPFAPNSPGYVKETGFPAAQDLDEAKRLVAEYEKEKGKIPSLTLKATPGALTLRTATFFQQSVAEIGITLEMKQVQQAELIRNAISGSYDLMVFRNYPGGDPDELSVWFKSDSPVNFSRFKDPEIDKFLAQGRAEPDPEKRAKIYQGLNKRMGEQVYSIWANYTTWMIAAQPKVFGFDPKTFPLLPNGDHYNEGLALAHPTIGLWVAK